MFSKPQILGLIPARGGSRGLPGKNIRPLMGTPLIAHTIEKAKRSSLIDRLVVLTDGEEIRSVARAYGAEVPFIRPAEISTADSHAFQAYKYTLMELARREGYRPDILCVMLCTTPFRSTEDIDRCLRKMIETGCDWCFTVNPMEHHPYRAVKVEGDRMYPFFDISRDVMWANRQELPMAYRFNGGVIAGRCEHILAHDEYNIDNGAFKHVDVRCVMMSEENALDIDNLTDFEFVELQMQKRGLR